MPDPTGFDCVYCGAPADTVEHCTPQAHHRAIRETDPFGLRNVLIPACRDCNCSLGDYPYAEISRRGGRLLAVYRQRWRKILDSAVWSQEELEELGPGLKPAVAQQQLHREEIVRRMAHLRQWDAWG